MNRGRSYGGSRNGRGGGGFGDRRSGGFGDRRSGGRGGGGFGDRRGRGRGGGGFGNRGGGSFARGSYNQGPPDTVIELGSNCFPCEDQLVVKCSIESVPYFNAPVYLENKQQIGKVDEIFGPIRDYYISVSMSEDVKAASFTNSQKFYIDPSKLLPLQRFLPKPPGTPSSRGGRGRGQRGGRGGGRGFGRGGFSRGGGRGGGGFRGGSFRGRGGGPPKKRMKC